MKIKGFVFGFLSAALLFVGLWQLEILFIQYSNGYDKFVLPFEFETTWWIARDIWYSFIVLAFVLMFAGLCRNRNDTKGQSLSCCRRAVNYF